jgi:hypothetical protein
MPLEEIYRSLNKLELDERNFSSKIPEADLIVVEHLQQFLLKQATTLRRHLDLYGHYNFSDGERVNYLAALDLTDRLVSALGEDNERAVHLWT